MKAHLHVIKMELDT